MSWMSDKWKEIKFNYKMANVGADALEMEAQAKAVDILRRNAFYGWTLCGVIVSVLMIKSFNWWLLALAIPIAYWIVQHGRFVWIQLKEYHNKKE